MKKTILMLVLLAVVSIIFSAGVSAEEMAVEKMMIAPPDDGNAFGQNHYYSVIFDEEGDAIVAAKLKVQNTGRENLTELQIEIPGESVRVVNMLQEVQKQEKRCSYWEKICVDYDDETETCKEFKEKCSNWYWQQSWPPYYHTIEKTAEQLSKSVKYDLELPVPIEGQKTGTILIYYKVRGYVDNGLGVYDFDFETIKLNQDISQIRVSINVLEGLYLKGGEANVDYRPSFGEVEKVAMAAEAGGTQSQDMQRFSGQIEYQQGYAKTAQGLDPWESFHVEGKYATSWLMLHKFAVIFGAIILILVVGGIVMGFKKLITSKKQGFLAMFGIGSGSAILLILNWVLFSFIIKNSYRWFGYQYRELLALLLILLAAIITLALLVGPALYVGLTSGVKNGFIVLGIEILMLVVLSIVVILFLAVTSNIPQPIYRVMAEAVSVG